MHISDLVFGCSLIAANSTYRIFFFKSEVPIFVQIGDMFWEVLERNWLQSLLHYQYSNKVITASCTNQIVSYIWDQSVAGEQCHQFVLLNHSLMPSVEKYVCLKTSLLPQECGMFSYSLSYYSTRQLILVETQQYMPTTSP